MTRTTLHRLLGSARAPILALVAGVGFVVQGWSLPADARGAGVPVGTAAEQTRPGTATADPSGWRLLPVSRSVEAPSHLLETVSSVQALAGSPDNRNVRGRGPGGPPSWTPSSLPGHRGTDPVGGQALLAYASSPAGSARAVAARDALVRAGRLGAPSTAPPVLSF